MKDSTIRLQKFLSERGITSRRKAAELIKLGKISVNGVTVTEPGLRISPDIDQVMVNGTTIPAQVEKRRTILLNKPRGYICSTSSKQGMTIYELLPQINERLLPAGRLDKNSEGLLILSNDGDLLNQLTHPKYDQNKTYEVTVSGNVDSRVLTKLQSRMIIDGYLIRPAEVEVIRSDKEKNRTLLKFELKEGRNRQIRKMSEKVGLKVHKLKRTKIKTIKANGLQPGQWRDLTLSECASLLTPKPPKENR